MTARLTHTDAHATQGFAAIFLFTLALFMGAVGVVVHQNSGHGFRFGPRVEIGSPTTPNRHPFHAAGCPALEEPPQGRRYVQIVNNCDETVWPGISPPGAAGVPKGGWAWEPQECKTLEVSSQLPSLRIWGRTGCDSRYKCITGTCMVDGCVCLSRWTACTCVFRSPFLCHRK